MVSQQEFQALVDKLDAVIDELEGKLARVDAAGEAALRALDTVDLTAGFVEWHRRRIRSAVLRIKKMIRMHIDLLRSLHRGIHAPYYMWRAHEEWERVRDDAHEVSKQIKVSAKEVGDHWEGEAAVRYLAAADKQAVAATRVATIAAKTAFATLRMAWAGLKFVVVLYLTAVAWNVACAGIVLSVIGGRLDAALLTAIGGIATLIGGIYNAFHDFVSAQTEQAMVMSSESKDPGGFALDGTWPKAVSSAVSEDFANNPNKADDWVAKP